MTTDDEVLVITKESLDNAETITHDGYVYVKYNDLKFIK